MPIKFLLAILILAVLGLPILELWKMSLLLAAWLALACSGIRLSGRRIMACATVVAVVMVAKSLLPGAAIEEGHNIFLYSGVEDAVQRGLPPAIRDEWRRAFEKHYPVETDRDPAWRKSSTVALYAPSSDALWRTAEYSRRVDSISFGNLSEFRGGFANDTRYNFFGDDPLSIARNFQAQLPFFVMYEFSEQSVGCTLYWHGIVYWQKDARSFEKIIHQEDAGRTIRAEDVGRRVYALNIPKVIAGGYKEWTEYRKTSRARQLSELSIHLELSPKLAASRVAGNVLSFIGVIALIALMTRICWRPLLIALGITVLSLTIIGVFIHFSEGKFLGFQYPPHGGGDDGLSHESVGRDIARELMAGEWKEALRGGQSIYWDTPGMRYARAVEKVIFGDTNLGYTAFVALLPWFVYLFINHLAGFKWAIVGSLFFLFSPISSLSFIQYVQNAKLGYAEAMAFGFFMLGFYLFMRSQPRWEGQPDSAAAFAGGICLAGSIFLRPNFAIAVSLLGLFFVFDSWRERKFKVMFSAMAGLAFALWMPLHNYLYGYRFVLISLSGATILISLGPSTYIQAIYEFISGNWKGLNLIQVTRQLGDWLWTLPRLSHPALKVIAEFFMVLKLLTLAVTAFIALRPKKKYGAFFVLAWTALAAHIPMLVIHGAGQFRYAMLGWDLSAILTFVILVDRIRKEPSQCQKEAQH